MTRRAEPTFRAVINIAGPIDVIKQVCRKYCKEEGLCVTVTPTTFIYKGGEEEGAQIGLVNYPRFPDTNFEIRSTAKKLAEKIRENTYQDSYLVVDDEETFWFTERE